MNVLELENNSHTNQNSATKFLRAVFIDLQIPLQTEFFRQCMPFLNFPILHTWHWWLCQSYWLLIPWLQGWLCDIGLATVAHKPLYPYQLFIHTVNKGLKQSQLIYNTQTCTRPQQPMYTQARACVHMRTYSYTIYISIHLHTHRCTRIPTGRHTHLHILEERGKPPSQ